MADRKRNRRRRDEEDYPKTAMYKQVQDEVLRHADTKWYVKSVSSNFGVSTTTYGDFTDIPQGSTSVTRVGDRLRLKNLSFHFQIYESAAVYTASVVRLIIFQWHPSSASSPLDTQILAFSSWNSPLRMDTRSQYKVLYDKTEYAISTTAKNYHLFSGTINFKDPLDVQFEAGTTTGTNKIYVIYDAGVSRSTTNCTGTAMLRFYDY